MGLIKKEVAVIAGVEVAFGILEAIVIPNITGYKENKKFVLPDKATIGKGVASLLITGTISGFVADYVINKWNIQQGTQRTLAIAGVAIAINVFEAIITPNIQKPFNKDWKFTMPSYAEFTAGMALLTFTAVIGGYVSDGIIAGLNQSQQNEPVLVPVLAQNSNNAVGNI